MIECNKRCGFVRSVFVCGGIAGGSPSQGPANC
jgi:hypothetical protein